MLEQIVEILSQYTATAEITPETILTSDLGFSSFEMVSIVAAFEDAFNIEIPDRDIRKLTTVKDIEVYLAEKLK